MPRSRSCSKVASLRLIRPLRRVSVVEPGEEALRDDFVLREVFAFLAFVGFLAGFFVAFFFGFAERFAGFVTSVCGSTSHSAVLGAEASFDSDGGAAGLRRGGLRGA